MKRSALTCIMTALLLNGCAQRVFLHDSKGPNDFAREKYDCELIATQYTANMGFAGNPFIVAEQIERCMSTKYGWRVERQPTQN